MLLDPHDSAVAHVDDGSPTAQEVRATALQRPLVGGIELDPREAHADHHAVGETDGSVDHDVIVLGGAIGYDLEDAVAADDHSLGLAGAHPFDVRVEHRLDRVEISIDEGAVAAEEKLGALVAHTAESMEPRGLEPLTFWLPARRSPS